MWETLHIVGFYYENSMDYVFCVAIEEGYSE